MTRSVAQCTVVLWFCVCFGCSARSVPEISALSFDQSAIPIHHIAFSPDGQRIATGHIVRHQRDTRVHYLAPLPSYVRLWSAQWGEQQEQGFIVGDKGNRCLTPTFASDSSLILLDDDEVLSCDRDGRILERRAIPRSLAIDVGHQLVACATDDDKPSRVLVRGFNGEDVSDELHGPDGRGRCLGRGLYPSMFRAFSPDGRLVTTQTFCREELLIWDWASGRIVGQFDCHHEGQIFPRVAFKNSSDVVAFVFSENEVRLHDIGSGRLIRSFQQDHGEPFDLCFSPDSRLLALCGVGNRKGDENFGFLIVWDANSGQQVASITRSDVWAITAVEFSPDGETLAAGLSDGKLVTYSREKLLE